MKRTQATGSHRRYRAKGCALQAARKSQSWTQKQVIDALYLEQDVFIDVRTYRRWEQGHSSMTLHQVNALCTIFQRTDEQLGLREEPAENASGQRSFTLEIEGVPSAEGTNAFSASDTPSGEAPSSVQVPLSASSIIGLAIVNIRVEDLIDLLRQKHCEHLSRLASLSSLHDEPAQQSVVLAIAWLGDQNTST